jgi:DNA-binding transcriptional ArsR family regulator
MDMEDGYDPERAREIEPMKLPPSFSTELPASDREALGHRVRRQILRVLIASEEPRSPDEIVAAALPDADLDVVSYHAKVLQACGSVTRAGLRRGEGIVTSLYAANVADNKPLLAALRETEQRDLKPD